MTNSSLKPPDCGSFPFMYNLFSHVFIGISTFHYQYVIYAMTTDKAPNNIGCVCKPKLTSVKQFKQGYQWLKKNTKLETLINNINRRLPQKNRSLNQERCKQIQRIEVSSIILHIYKSICYLRIIYS